MRNQPGIIQRWIAQHVDAPEVPRGLRFKRFPTVQEREIIGNHQVSLPPLVRIVTSWRIKRFPKGPMELSQLLLAYALELENGRVDENPEAFPRWLVVADHRKAPQWM